MNAITMTVQRASAVTGLGKTKLYELINDNKIKTTKVGRRRLINVESLRSLVGDEGPGK